VAGVMEAMKRGLALGLPFLIIVLVLGLLMKLTHIFQIIQVIGEVVGTDPHLAAWLSVLVDVGLFEAFVFSIAIIWAIGYAMGGGGHA